MLIMTAMAVISSSPVDFGAAGSFAAMMYSISCSLAAGIGFDLLSESQLLTQERLTPHRSASCALLIPNGLLSHFLICSLVNTEGIVTHERCFFKPNITIICKKNYRNL